MFKSLYRELQFPEGSVGPPGAQASRRSLLLTLNQVPKIVTGDLNKALRFWSRVKMRRRDGVGIHVLGEGCPFSQLCTNGDGGPRVHSSVANVAKTPTETLPPFWPEEWQGGTEASLSLRISQGGKDRRRRCSEYLSIYTGLRLTPEPTQTEQTHTSTAKFWEMTAVWSSAHRKSGRRVVRKLEAWT